MHIQRTCTPDLSVNHFSSKKASVVAPGLEHRLFSLSKDDHIVRIKSSTEFCIPVRLPMALGGCQWCFSAAEVWDIPDSLWLKMPSDGKLMRSIVVEK